MRQQIAPVEMLIRRPAAEVFDAFADAETITRFWLAGTTGALAPGARVTWTFMVPGATEHVAVTAFERPERIAFDWSDGVQVTLTFATHGDGATRVAADIGGLGDDIAAIVDAAIGFSIVLCDLKTLLETGRSAGLVRAKAELIGESAALRATPDA